MTSQSGRIKTEIKSPQSFEPSLASLNSAGCPKIKVSIKNFNSDLLISLIHSF